ncbi:MAG: transporter [Candidatus Competibacteraceae bacterium]
MITRILSILASVIFYAFIGVDTAHAYDLPPGINLGLTSFLDGGPPAGPGFYFTQYLQYYTADKFMDKNGDRIPFPNPRLDVWAAASQFIYQSDQPLLLDGKWGMNLIVPVIHLDVDYGDSGPFPQDNGGGLGDITVGPFLQWDPIMGAEGPLFMHRIELQFLLPTGKYDNNHELNPGSNFFSFNPYWAATVFFTPKLTSSIRLHYLWNAENHNPPRSTGADDIQAGQAIHANFTLAYQILPQLRVGLNGYYLRQITDTQIDGSEVGGTRERVLGLGPGMLYHISKDDHLFFNTYFESQVENRTQGKRFVLRYVHHF